MTDREKITEILKAYTKKHNIMASSVILEEYAEELIRQGVVKVVRCKDCKHRTNKGICEKFRQRYPFFPEDDFYCGFGELKELK